MNKYVDNNDGTITDHNTGLVWQQATADTKMNWETALDYCENLILAGHSDWRLPAIKELQSIVDYESYDPTIDSVFFSDTTTSYYWSSTTSANNTGDAWLVSFNRGCFNRGCVYDHGKSHAYYVRAVRGGLNRGE